MSWASVVGQSRAKEILRVSLQRNRLAHAYLFIGQEGSGKYAIALELAKVINCEHGQEEACDNCASCRKFKTLQHPNLKLIFPLPVGRYEKSNDPPLAKLSDDDIIAIQEQLNLKASNPYHKISLLRANTIKINSIREIRRQAALTIFGQGKKVFIIIDADKMSDEASNALLKTLEEPHPDTLLILTTTSVESLLPTIISRCQLIRLDPLGENVIAQALHENRNIELQRSKTIARLVNGNYTKALRYIDADYEDRQNKAIGLLRAMLMKSRTAVLEEIEKLIDNYQKPEIEDILRLMQQWLQDSMLLKEGIKSEYPLPSTEAHEKFINHYPDWDYAGSFGVIDRAVSLLGKNVYIPLLLIDLTFKLKKFTGIASSNR